jgi:hypothetical protein
MNGHRLAAGVLDDNGILAGLRDVLNEVTGMQNVGLLQRIGTLLLPEKFEIGPGDQFRAGFAVAADSLEMALNGGRTVPDLEAHPAPASRGKLVHVVGEDGGSESGGTCNEQQAEEQQGWLHVSL